MKPTFLGTVGILVAAYMAGTLVKGDCRACAVGNLVASANNIQITTEPFDFGDGCNDRVASWQGGRKPMWGKLFSTDSEGYQSDSVKYLAAWPPRFQEQRFPEMLVGEAELLSTGYTVEQLKLVEFFFETAMEGYSREAEFAGIMAVVDVLAEIHGVDLGMTEEAKKLFTKDQEMVTVERTDYVHQGHCTPVGA